MREEALKKAIFNVIKASGHQWQTRLQIAAHLNRPTRLNPYDLQILGVLAQENFIEINKRVSRGTVQVEYVYRVKIIGDN